MTASTFAATHARRCSAELARYLRAGVELRELEELVADMCHALKEACAFRCGGGDC